MTIKDRLGTFGVGVVAAACAAVFPRLAVAMGAPDQAAYTVTLFTPQFVALAAGFVVLVALVVVILQWNGRPSPKDTFMAALGVPALLSGALNTGAVSTEAREKATLAREATEQLAKDAGVPVLEQPMGLAPRTDSSSLRFGLLPMALAAAAPLESEGSKSWVGTTFQEPRYWLVLQTSRSRSEADARSAELKARFPDFEARFGPLKVQEGSGTYVLSVGERPMPFSEAVSKAVRLKKESTGALLPQVMRAR
jgi:hypothetical protein